MIKKKIFTLVLLAPNPKPPSVGLNTSANSLTEVFVTFLNRMPEHSFYETVLLMLQPAFKQIMLQPFC